MRKRVVTVVLILGIFLTFTGPAFSAWGPKIVKPGPTVIYAHPWGESGHTGYTPPCYRAGSGAGFRDMVIAKITNFTAQFYLKYVAKEKKDGQSSIRYNDKSE
jgi:hypothetical protein